MAMRVSVRLTGRTDKRHEQHRRPARAGKASTAMSMISRLRSRRNANRQARALDRALRSAPTQSMRDELLVIAQRYHV